MNNYYQVDRKGNPVEIYALYEGDVVPEDFKLLWEYPQRFFSPIWDFKQRAWVENEDLTEKINLAKQAKKEELSLSCQEHILSGFNYKVNNVEYHFSYDREAQNNYQERWQLFQNNMIESIVVTGHTLNGEDVRLPMNKEQFDKLYLSSVMHKENCIKKLRDDLLPLLNSSNGMKDVESISWDMEVLTPKPETVIIKDDKLLNREIQRLESETALGTNEIMNLMFMLQMQGMF